MVPYPDPPPQPPGTTKQHPQHHLVHPGWRYKLGIIYIVVMPHPLMTDDFIHWTSCSLSTLIGTSHGGKRWTSIKLCLPSPSPGADSKEVKKSKDGCSAFILLPPEIIQMHDQGCFCPMSMPDAQQERVQIIHSIQNPLELQCHHPLIHYVL